MMSSPGDPCDVGITKGSEEFRQVKGVYEQKV